MTATVAAVVCALTFVMPANADVNGTTVDGAGVVTSSRSFPSVAATRRDLTSEHTSTEVEEDSDWGGIEDLSVPATKSQAEKEQEAAETARKAAEAEAAKQAAERNQQSQQAETQSASRSGQRESTQQSTQQTYIEDDANVSAGAGAMVSAAYALIGQHMDCTALVSAALAAAGIDFHGYPEEYASVGQQVTDGTMKPGDILIYRYTGGWNGGAHWDHVALYVGDGKAIHGGWNGTTVALAGTMNPDMVVRVF